MLDSSCLGVTRPQSGEHLGVVVEDDLERSRKVGSAWLAAALGCSLVPGSCERFKLLVSCPEAYQLLPLLLCKVQ